MPRLLPIALMLLVGLAACASTDPLKQTGKWTPEGANETNLTAMVADPHDLDWGRSSPGFDGYRAARAVQRLEENRVKPLPSSGTSGFKLGGSDGAQGSEPSTGTSTVGTP